jgi:signal transduction histidine kinase
MKIAEIPKNEKNRLEELQNYQILDTDDEKDFNDIVELASSICETPMSLVSLVDSNRQWFKAKVGIDADETPRDVSFCAHTILQNDIFIIPDASKDERFLNNPFVSDLPKIRFYAGMTLHTPNGFNLGSLCVVDTKPRKLKPHQINALRILGKQVINLFELKKKNKELNESNEIKNRLFSIISHDLRTPLSSIDMYLQMLEGDFLTFEQSKVHLSELRKALSSSFSLLDSLFLWAKSQIENINFERKKVNLYNLIQNEVDKLNQWAIEKGNSIINDVNSNLYCILEPNQFGFIIRNLISNSIKYTNNGNITITSNEYSQTLNLTISDTGIGMNKSKLDSLFNWSVFNSSLGTNGEKGTGFGLLIIKEFINNHNGNIEVRSEEGKGTEITISIIKS